MIKPCKVAYSKTKKITQDDSTRVFSSLLEIVTKVLLWFPVHTYLKQFSQFYDSIKEKTKQLLEEGRW